MSVASAKKAVRQASQPRSATATPKSTSGSASSGDVGEPPVTLSQLDAQLRAFSQGDAFHDALQKALTEHRLQVLAAFDTKFHSSPQKISPRGFLSSRSAFLTADEYPSAEELELPQLEESDYVLGTQYMPIDVMDKESGGRAPGGNQQSMRAMMLANAAMRTSNMEYIPIPHTHSEDSIGTPRWKWTKLWSIHKQLQRFFYNIVDTQAFENCVAFLVFVNAVVLGFDTDCMARNRAAAKADFTKLSERIFCLLFTLEISMRLFVFRLKFFHMDGWRWNVFDFVIVVNQIVEQLVQLISVDVNMDLSVLRALRILRVLRILRILRVLHLFDELRVIVSSIASSTPALCWSVLLLLMTIYIFTLVFLQIILSKGDTQHHEVIAYWFANVPRAGLTLFECIVGGVSWDEVITPLILDISPLLGFAFCIYISSSLFAMMNLLTGVFVDTAMRTVREDKDVVLASRIRDLFMKRDGPNEDAEITKEMFMESIHTKAMQEYFKQINVEIECADSLFELIDADGGGTLDSNEIVEGCLRLRGPARALELTMVMREVKFMREELAQLHALILSSFKLTNIKAGGQQKQPETPKSWKLTHQLPDMAPMRASFSQLDK